MSTPLKGQRIIFIVANEGIEQVELTEPWEAVRTAGGTPLLASTKPGKAQAFNHLDRGDTFAVDVTTDELRVEVFDGVVLPGGVANPDQLRTDQNAVTFIRNFIDGGKPVAAICHGPWTLVEADVVEGRRLTSWPSLQTDIRNAGGDWVDEEVVVCSNGPNVLVTSRKPDDLEAFGREFTKAFAAGPKVNAA
jgi:protease I